ncbi:MAG TPA: pectin esterase, partial [bacterium]|nr:pectin esterase [bacterium]
MRSHLFPRILLAAALFIPAPLFAAAPGCVGFASVDGDASQGMFLAGGTVGGAGGTAVTVTTQAQFTAAATQTGPLTIVVQGLIQVSPLGQKIQVQSNKSILGDGCGSGLSGGWIDLDGRS